MNGFKSRGAASAVGIVAAGLLAACQGGSEGAPPKVAAVRETPPVDIDGDAADDPAIWVAQRPEDSLVVATQKKGGLYVYDLQARLVQSVPGGRPNNVDLRPGFAWPGGVGAIVGAGDRTDNALVFWRLDPITRRLDAAPSARIPTGFKEVYGFCIGRLGQDLVAVATDKDSGDVGVWKILVDAGGVLSGERIASFSTGSITEGCVIDDQRSVVFLADELRGIWIAPLGDPAGAGRRLIDTVGGKGNLVADVEGLSLWSGADGGGYLVASVQGDSRFAVYDRAPPHAYRGSFAIGAGGGADAVSGTDGIDVSSAPLGPDFPAGLMVAQDDENTDPAATQDFKFVSWAAVAVALRLSP